LALGLNQVKEIEDPGCQLLKQTGQNGEHYSRHQARAVAAW
jgi:hypothetical protein